MQLPRRQHHRGNANGEEKFDLDLDLLTSVVEDRRFYRKTTQAKKPTYIFTFAPVTLILTLILADST